MWLGPQALLARLDDKPDRRSRLSLNLNLCKRGYRDQVDTVGGDEPTRDCDCLDRLVYRAGTDGLHFGGTLFTEYSC